MPTVLLICSSIELPASYIYLCFSSSPQVEKHIKQEGLVSPKSSCSSILPSKVFQESIFKDRDRTSSTSESKPVTPLPSDEQMDTRDITGWLDFVYI